MRNFPNLTAIIGAGIQGCALAAELADKGVKNIIVFDAAPIAGQGATRRSAGMRMLNNHLGDPDLMRLNAASMNRFNKVWKKKLKFPGGSESLIVNKQGSVLAATTDQVAGDLPKRVEYQNSLGIETVLFSPNKLAKKIPHLNSKKIKAAMYCPSDDHIDQNMLVDAYRQYAQERGVVFNFNTEVVGIEIERNKVVAIKVENGDLATEKIQVKNLVNAAGSSAKKIGSMAGINLPLRNKTRTLWLTQIKKNYVNVKFPILEILDGLFSEHYAKYIGDGQLQLSGGKDGEKYLEDLDATALIKPKKELIKAAKQFWNEFTLNLELNNESSWSGWIGVRTLTPDEKPLLGPVKKIKGFYLLCGMSGYGITNVGKTAELVANWVTGKTNNDEWNSFLLSQSRFN